MGAELARKRAGEPTKTGMSEAQLADFARKPTKASARQKAMHPGVAARKVANAIRSRRKGSMAARQLAAKKSAGGIR